MADSVSIVMKMNEDISAQLKTIASTSKGVSKEFEQMQQKTQALAVRYDAFNKKSAEVSAQALAVKKQMDEASKAFRKTGDEADRVRFERLREEYSSLTDSAKNYSEAAKSTMKDIKNVQEAMRKADGAAPGRSDTTGLGSALRNSGLIKELSGSVSNAAGVLIESAIGQPMAAMASEIVSGALSGAAAGALAGSAVLPGIGTLAGAGIGAVSGLLSGGTQIYQQRDDAFKEYYKSLVETVTGGTEESLAGGKTLAAGRETTKLSFDTLLGGKEQSAAFLQDVLNTANTTPFLYDDLVGISKTLLSFGYAVEDVIPTLTKVGDAGAALGLSTADIGTVATYIGRMRSSDKASLEYLNPLNERGLGVFQWLAEDLGVSQRDVYDKISKGELSGSYVSQLLLSQFEKLYGGMMGIQSKSTEGLDSTLQGLLENIDAAGGDRYNDLRKQGKEQDIAAYGGTLGKALANVNALAGETQARLDNLSAQYNREALSAVLLGEKTSVFSDADAAKLEEMRQQYIAASALYEQSLQATGEGNLKAAQDMVSLRESAEALATAAYESSDAYRTVQDVELEKIAAIRDNTAGLAAATAAFERSNAFTKGQVAAWLGKTGSYFFGGGEAGAGVTEEFGDELAAARAAQAGGSFAFGLRRVPFNGYRAVLHEGERVQTAEEVRRADAGGGMQITFSGPITVRQDSDLEQLARRLADEIELRGLSYGG